jgi:hypothetical protein
LPSISVIETAISTLVNFLGMRRVNTRGLQPANKCLLMAAVCYNLKRLLKWTADGIGNTKKTLHQFLFLLWLLLVQHGGKHRLAVAVSK